MPFTAPAASDAADPNRPEQAPGVEDGESWNDEESFFDSIDDLDDEDDDFYDGLDDSDEYAS